MQLQQQQDLGSQHESEIRESSRPNAESLSCQFTEEEIRVEELEYPSEYHSQNHELLSSSDSEKNQIRYVMPTRIRSEKLEADVHGGYPRNLLLRTTLQASSQDISFDRPYRSCEKGDIRTTDFNLKTVLALKV